MQGRRRRRRRRGERKGQKEEEEDFSVAWISGGGGCKGRERREAGVQSVIPSLSLPCSIGETATTPVEVAEEEKRDFRTSLTSHRRFSQTEGEGKNNNEKLSGFVGSRRVYPEWQAKAEGETSQVASSSKYIVKQETLWN